MLCQFSTLPILHSMAISAQQFQREAEEQGDGAVVLERGSTGWFAQHRRMSGFFDSFSDVKVMFDACADCAATSTLFFAGREAGSRFHGPPVPPPINGGIEARVYATCDETVLGRCACVTSAFSHPFEARRASLSGRPVWGVTIADSRLTSTHLYRVVELLLATLMSLGRVIDHADSMLGDPRTAHGISVQDSVRAIRRDAHAMAETSVHHGVRSLAASWAPSSARTAVAAEFAPALRRTRSHACSRR